MKKFVCLVFYCLSSTYVLQSQTIPQIIDTLNNMPANSWYTLPNSSATSVLYSNSTNTNIWGTSGPTAITNAWGSGAYDKKNHRFFLWGGGHSDYHGNEVYVFSTDSFYWQRLTEPSADSIVAFPQGDADPLIDGQPCSRHTYGNLVYIENSEKLFSGGGGLPYSTFQTDKTWAFDFNSKTWENRMPQGVSLPGLTSYWNLSSAYDPNSGFVYMKSQWNMLRYDYVNNTWWQSNNSTITASGDVGGACIIPNKNLFFRIGNGDFFAYNTLKDSIEDWSLNINDKNIGYCTGIAHDSKANEVLAIKKDSLWSLNLQTKVWTQKSYSISPFSLGAQGPFGRWQYLPEYNIFMLVASMNDNIYFYKNTIGGGSTTTSINSNIIYEDLQNLEIYPNPSNGIFTIDSKKATKIVIYDILGTKIQEFNLAKGKNKLHLSKNLHGIYALISEFGFTKLEIQ
jgi:hypothetical protein